jgi:hypothetical protein
VVVNVRLKSTIAQAFSSLESGQMPEGSSSPERPLGHLSPSGEIRGRIASIPMSLLPEHFQQFAATIQEESRRGPDGYGILRRRPRSGSRCYP